MDAIQIISTFLLILINGLAAVLTCRFSRLPLTLCVLLWGIISAALIPVIGFDTGVRADNFQILVMYVLIPVLVFEAALSIDLKVLKPLLVSILFASTVGTVLAMMLAAAFIFYAIGHPDGFPWIAALIAGLVISATDPVAVVDQLKQSKAPDSLATLIEGESLFNDATAIVLFGLLIALALGHTEPSSSGVLLDLGKVLIGGVVVGALVAAVSILLLTLIPASSRYFVLLSLTSAYSSFFIAEYVLHVSGVISVLVCALLIKNKLYSEGNGKHQVHESWSLFGFMANLVVFYLMGLVVTFDMFTEQWLAMLIGIAAAFVSRLVSSYLTLAVGKWIFRNPLEWRFAPVMVWGGLRGVVTLALVLSLPIELDYWWTIQSMGFGVVLFTLLCQATTTPFLLKGLRLVKVD